MNFANKHRYEKMCSSQNLLHACEVYTVCGFAICENMSLHMCTL